MSMHTDGPAPTVTRRVVLAGAMSAAAALGLARAGALAQSATPAASTGTGTGAVNVAGYPELKATITDQEVKLSAQSVPAGLVVLTVENQTQSETGAGVLGPGPGQTMQDLQNAAATPTPDEGFPAFFYTATILGGPGTVAPGASQQAIIDVKEGDWVVFTEGNQPPAFFSATAGTPTAQVPPIPLVEIIEVDFAFGGFATLIPAGQQIWKVTNMGSEPHMLSLSQVPAGTTLEQVLALAATPDNATPAPGELGRDDFQDRGGVILQSSGTTCYPVLDLPTGRYAALCFVPDPVHGMIPHIMEGMVAVFDVGSSGQASATPAA
jgi:hypothetical protein